MAKDIRIIFSGDSSRADAAIKSLENSGKQAASILEREFNQLGIKSALSFDNQRAAADKAYNRIKSSGMATASELESSQKAHAAAMSRIDEEQHGKRVGLLDKFKTNWLAVTASIAAAWALTNKAMTMAQEGAAFQQQGTSFANLAAASGVSADKMIADLRRLSGETVSVQQLVEKAGTAMLLGVESQAIPKLMEIAKASSRITGQTVTEAFGDLSLAVARQSKMILDNLGIMVDVEKANKDYAASLGKTADQLNDADRKQAFLNATLKEGEEILAKVGKTAETDADKMAKFTASVDDIGKSVGILLSGPMASLSAEMSATVGWLEAYKSGQIGFWEWATTGADAAAEKLKGLRVTNLDATVSAEGQDRARKLIEDKAREAAVAAKTESAQRLVEIQSHNDKIIAIEQKRIKTSFNQESTHLRQLTADYAAAVTSMDSLISARQAVQNQLSARNAADVAKSGGGQDAFYTYMDQQQEIKDSEYQIAQTFGMSAEAKVKAYADLIDQAASYNRAVSVNGREVIAAWQAEANYQEDKARLQEKISQLLDEEGAKRTATAASFAAEMQRSESAVRSFENEISALDALLNGMNNKEINIIFRAQNVNQLLTAGGSDSIIIPPSTGGDIPQYASGTPYVPRTGLALIHQGERIIPASENRSGSMGNTVTIAPVIHLSGVSATGGEKTARELAREIEPELRKLAGRYRA